MKRTDVVWRNAMKNIAKVSFLFKLYDLCLKYDVPNPINNDIKAEIWLRRDDKEVWLYIASKELEVSNLECLI